MTKGTERQSMTQPAGHTEVQIHGATEGQAAGKAGSQANQSTPDSALLVAGMHRSGTSALTRVLNLLGYRLAGDLLAPSADNVTGFWESSSLNGLHDRALATMGLRWSTPTARDDSWFDTAEGKSFAVELGDSLRRWFPGPAPFAVKDPRICRVIPSWQSVLEAWGVPRTIIIPIRHPVEVASSLQTRGGIPIESGLLLWLWSVLDAERDTRGADRSFLSYDELLTDWRGVLARVAEETGLSWPIEVGRVGDAVDEFLRPDLRHQRFSGPLSGGELHSWVKAVYTEVRKAADRGLASLDTGVLDEVRREAERADALYGNAIRDAERTVSDKRFNVSFVGGVSLFDAEWYRRMYPDVRGTRWALRQHYLRHGWREGRWPHPLFDSAFYLARNPDVACADVEPLTHYELMGWRDGRDPNPLFSVAWYLEQNPDIAALGIEPVGHYARFGWREGRQPHPLFDVTLVRLTDPELSKHGAPSTDPLATYLHGGC